MIGVIYTYVYNCIYLLLTEKTKEEEAEEEVSLFATWHRKRRIIL
jgi:hypothetical protein